MCGNRMRAYAGGVVPLDGDLNWWTRGHVKMSSARRGVIGLLQIRERGEWAEFLHHKIFRLQRLGASAGSILCEPRPLPSPCPTPPVPFTNVARNICALSALPPARPASPPLLPLLRPRQPCPRRDAAHVRRPTAR
ncbi:unnamed protein product [Chondrus crispus]|uniref:Uncharacterized protein n=1 Tax=Chondrus crispus TaxID=2769 RepID=R7Q1Q9_CHOCR|nr:unnamed protein product [Chondrus crispus]CDF32507.1 unnamed protein product [Chondrus crispus]|eukprot:XP_005712172.1 unnamed protein product [Chondrus crispus]